MKFAIGIAAILAAAIGAAGLASCGQSEGQRCQIEADCSGGLVCNLATDTCETTSSGDLDAKPPPDTFIIKFDSPPGLDTAPEAGIDGGIDAVPDGSTDGSIDSAIDGAPSDI